MLADSALLSCKVKENHRIMVEHATDTYLVDLFVFVIDIFY